MCGKRMNPATKRFPFDIFSMFFPHFLVPIATICLPVLHAVLALTSTWHLCWQPLHSGPDVVTVDVPYRCTCCNPTSSIT